MSKEIKIGSVTIPTRIINDWLTLVWLWLKYASVSAILRLLLLLTGIALIGGLSYALYVNPSQFREDALDLIGVAQENNLTIFAQVMPQVYNLLKESTEKNEALGVGYFQYHDGIETDGFPFLFFSAISTYSTDSYIDPTLTMNIPVSANLPLLVAHSQKQCFFEKFTDSSLAYRIFKVRETVSCPVIVNKNVIGFVLIAWGYHRSNFVPESEMITTAMELRDAVRIALFFE